MVIVEFSPADKKWRTLETTTATVTGTFDTEAQAIYFAKTGQVVSAEAATRALETINENRNFVSAYSAAVVQMYELQKKLLVMSDTLLKKGVILTDADTAHLGITAAEFGLAVQTLSRVLMSVSDLDSKALYKVVPLPSM